MDDGHSAPSDDPLARVRATLSPGSMAAHHRRRRLGALAVLAGLALVVGIAVGAGSSSSGNTHAVRKVAAVGGFLQRIKTLAGSGPGSLVTAEQVDENAAITRTMAYAPAVRMAGTQHREIALTFDDGPGPYTPQVLAVLERLHVPATFFEVGVEEHYFHASTAKLVARGYPIGDHTEDHAPMSHLSRKLQQQQLLEQTSAIGDYGAPFPRMFRPPYGLWNSTTLSLLKKYRMLMVLWTVDTNDWQEPGVSAIVNSAVQGAKPGAIILMHDAGGNRSQTIQALPTIVHTLRKKGYKLVTVPRLLLDNPAPRQQDTGLLQGAGG
jgi:peptidoglycan/xylan/chitin deacetylase (PgdA/CDA1 family)